MAHHLHSALAQTRIADIRRAATLVRVDRSPHRPGRTPKQTARKTMTCSNHGKECVELGPTRPPVVRSPVVRPPTVPDVVVGHP